ncbi:phage tail tape measure protein [Paraclostridium bifermentans]|uniref:phage tail tape measure protein n=1 Tax=Paraclostridium bifermentans TaxID=1490 RepID=UPI00189CA9B3|nr:phage tail tape measure protein [Paraclostridium bifermentans]
MFKIAKQIRILAKLDKSGFQKELNQLLKKGYDLNLNGGNFKSVVNDISKELNKLKSTLNNVNGNTFDNTASGVNKTKNAVKDLNSELTRMSSKNLSSTSIIADKNGLSEINKYKDGIAQTTSEVIRNGQVTKQVVTENISQFENLKAQLQNKLNIAKGNSFIDDSVLTNLQTKLNSINTNTPEKEFNELRNAINNLSSSDSGIVRLQSSINRLQERIANIKKNKIDVIDANEINEIKQAENEVNNLKNMLSQLQGGDIIDGKKITSSINQATSSVRTLESEFRNVNTTASGLATTMKSIFSYALGGSGIYLALNSMREAISTTISLDDSLRDLRRVTELTNSEYEKFMKVANQTAIELGTTTSGAIDATTRFSQLGYSFDEASDSLSRYGLILSNVADMSAKDASSAIVSVLKGFQMETSEVASIVDTINEAGNKFAIDSGGLANALQVGAANLSIAGNDLQQASALIITANEVMQDPTTVANGLKTISMRLRGVAEDGEELSASMNDLIESMTGVKVETDDGQLRSTYDILKDIGEVWERLDTKQQALLAEEIAGKNRANVFASLMQNAEQLENAYDTLKDSAGSAQKEQESYISSLSGKINALKESLTAISMQMIDSDMFKGLIDGATTGVQATSKLIDFFGTFPSIVGIATASLITFNSRIRENTNSMLQMIPGYSKVTTSIKGWSDSISKNITQLQSQKAELKISQEKALAAGESTSALGKKMLGLNTNLGVLKVGLAATKVAVVALNAAMSMALTMGISAIISGLGSLIDKILLTRSELNELNQEFITTNSDSEMSNVIDLVNTYEELENKLSTLKKGTSEYKDIEDKLASTQESILSIYPSASKAIEYNTEAKRLNLEATKKLIDKDLELAKSDALNILEKNDTKTDTGLDKAIEEYEEYYKVLEKVNDLAEKEETKSVNIESKLSDSGELLVNAKDVDVYKKRVESLNDTLEASYEAYKILGVSNDKYAEQAKKVGEVLGYSASQTEELINKLKETDESAGGAAEALTDINGDGIIDATDQMLKLAETTDEAKTAVQNLGDAFSQLESPIKILETAVEEFKEYGMLSDDTWSDIITSGNSELIALLGDNENFLKNAEQLYGNLKTQQEELAQQTIRRAQEDINASSQVVDATNAEISAVENLANTKENISSNSIQKRANMESILVDNNAKNYATDESNYVNKENYKIKGSFDSANERMRAEKETVDNNSQNYGTDDKNYLALALSKIQNGDSVATAAIDATKQMVDKNNVNYAKDSQNHTNYINALINNYRTLSKAQNGGFTMGTLGFKEESKMLIDEMNNRKNAVESATKEMQNAVNTYNGVSGVGGAVSHGNIGSGSSGNKGSSGSSSSAKEVENIEVETDRYYDLNNAIDKVNDALEINDILSKNANDDAKLKYIKEEISLYNQKRQALEKLQAEQKKELLEFRNSLSSNGFTFGADGNISNLNSRLKSLESWANSASGTEKENRQTTVKNIESMIDSYEDLRDKVSDINADILDINNSIIDAQKDIADIIKDQYEEWKDLEEKKTDKLKEEIQKRKEMMQKEWETEDYQDELDEEQNKLNELMAQRQDAIRTGNENLISQLDKEIEEQRKTINDLIRDQERNNASDKYDEMMDTLDKELEAKLEAMDEKVTDDALLQAVQSGATSLEDIFSNIDLASRSVNKNILMVSDGITDWNTKLNDFVSTLNSISASAITLDLSGSLQGVTTLAGSSNPINISTVINLEGGTVISEATMNDIIAENNKYILKEVNNIFKR